jgi:hypothetical protein
MTNIMQISSDITGLLSYLTEFSNLTAFKESDGVQIKVKQRFLTSRLAADLLGHESES